MARTRTPPERAYVWIWLPGQTEPVVAGVLVSAEDVITFTYGRSYLGLRDAIPLYLPELPLGPGTIVPESGPVAGVIDDASPDSWGMRVILNRLAGRAAEDVTELSRMTYLLESSSDRIGALDFQSSSDSYEPRGDAPATLEQLLQAAELVDAGQELPPELDQALAHGSSIGGARPKATLTDGSRKLIAKFSSTSDTYPVVRGEFLSMTLARQVGLNVANVELTESMGRDVLLVERFDRPPDGTRRAMVSALTILGLNESTALFGSSYARLADEIRRRFTDSEATLHELFRRIVFNVLTGNTDDHPRNHAAFWDGQLRTLTLTPAYDLTPLLRYTGEAMQLMAIGRDGWRYSQLEGCIARADVYHLAEAEAREIVAAQISKIRESWLETCDMALLTANERRTLAGTAYFNPYAFVGYADAEVPTLPDR
jgi:serine/threonine-protein kinase HipA